MPVIPVSLILTTLNEAGNAAMFFDGVRAGSVRPEEIVICDGGSTDETVETFRREAGDLPVIIVEEHGATIAQGRNRAIAAARLDILAVTDAGCSISSTWLERITEPLLTDPAVDAVGGGYELVGERLVQRWTAAASIPLEDGDADGFLPSSRSFAARKSAIRAAGGYPEDLTFAGEDTALVLRMKALGQRFVTRWDARVQWYTRPTLRAFLRQHYFYGLGDGEARSHSEHYRRLALKWSLFPVLLIAGLFKPLLWFPIPLFALLYFLHLAPVYRWRRLPVWQAFGGFLFVVLKEWSMFIGALVGRLRGAPGRRPR
ncbi:MAG: glycosyltransferase [Bacteroidetes bacterium]|nr:glycosyltransferase [Bacteroidota bacterium]